MADLAFRSAGRLAALVRKRKIGCVELLDHFIARIEAHDGRLNAVVVRDFEAARRRAKALDRMKAPLGPLHGVPMTVKEAFDVAGLPTTLGVPARRQAIATRDAVVVQRLRAAGAVVMGKTNVPLMLGDWQSYNAIYGTTNNPWDLALSPGGSSGGSAAALAAGLAALECGTDIGGSIRQPAHACGVFGHKASWGVVPGSGAATTDMACNGPMARSAGDLALAMEVLAGPVASDTGMALRLPAGPRGVKGLRVAVWAEDAATHTAGAVSEAIRAAGTALKREGAKVSFTARPAVDQVAAFRTYMGLLAGALYSRGRPEELAAMAAEAAGLAADDLSADAWLLRGVGMSHGTWLDLHEARGRMKRAWGEFFAEWDVLLCPSLAVPAQPHQQGVPEREMRVTIDGAVVPWNDMLFWPGVIGAMLLPVTAAPLGMSPEGLPIGCQIVGPMHGDRTTIAVAGMLETLLGGFVAPPGWGARKGE